MATATWSALASELVQTADPAEVERLVGRLGEAGELWQHRPDVRLPRTTPCPPATATGWTERGFVPYWIKSVEREAAQVAALRAVFRGLASASELCVVPLWMADSTVVTLHHPAAMDLAEVVAEGNADRHTFERVTDACLDSLGRFAGHDARLRAALARASLPTPSFPVQERYRAAVLDLGRIMGGGSISDLPDLDLTLPGSPRVLFCDPKPANFLLGRYEVASWLDSGGPSPARVDLDLMHCETTLSLQAVLALFSHPLGPRDENGKLDLWPTLARGRAFVADHGVQPEEFNAMVLYHLIRNWTSAVRQGRQAKAHDFGEALIQVLPHLSVATSRLRDELSDRQAALAMG